MTKKEEQIQKILEEKVNPILGEHYGGAVLTAYEEGVVWVKFTGACFGCPSSQETLENIVRSVLMNEMPEIADVCMDNTTDSELLDFARQMLSGKKDLAQ